jgi:hypothetical protein
MKSPTANFNTEKNKFTSQQPRTLLEVDTDIGTVYYSDQTLTLANTYLPRVMNWGRTKSQLVAGESVIRTGTWKVTLTNNPRIDDIIRPGLVVRLYMWFANLAEADKLLWFKGTIDDDIRWDFYDITFTCMDIGDFYDKQVGIPLSPLTYPNADPDDLNKMEPVVYGSVKNVRGLAIIAGGASTLRTDLAIGAGTIELSDASQFPSLGTVIIGEEEDITYSGKSGNNLTGVANVSKPYVIGELVVEKTDVKFMAAGHAVSALSNPKIVPNGLTLKEAVAISSGVTLNTNDGGIATVAIDAASLPLIRKEVALAISPATHDHSIDTEHGHDENDPGHLHLTGSIVTTVLRAQSHSTSGSGVSDPLNSRDTNEDTNATINVTWPNLFGEITHVYPSGDLGTIQQVTLWVVYDFGLGGGTTGNFTLTWPSGSQVITSTAGSKTKVGIVIPVTDWSDFADFSYQVNRTAGTNNAICLFYEAWIEVRYTPDISSALTGLGVNRTGATELGLTGLGLAGNTVTDSLLGNLHVDIDGYEDDGSGTYTGVANALIEEPWDIIKHLIDNFSNGATLASDVDTASFTFLPN